MYLEHIQSVQYFADQFYFTTCQVLTVIVDYEKTEQVEEANLFRHQTLLIDSNSSINTCQTDCVRGSTALTVGLVVEATGWPGHLSSATLS